MIIGFLYSILYSVEVIALQLQSHSSEYSVLFVMSCKFEVDLFLIFIFCCQEAKALSRLRSVCAHVLLSYQNGSRESLYVIFNLW